MTGGGSGGHITPILAVARELKNLQHDVELIYIGQRGDQLLDVPAKSEFIDKTYSVRAGKFRRYHGEGIRQVLDVPTLLKNIRDAWRVVEGMWQSYRLLGKIKPDCVFIKGGFVGVPVGLAAVKRHIPFVTHDSDAIPGLANRIIARWAAIHAVALPKEVYDYPPEATVTVGVPVQSEFRAVNEKLQKAYKKQIGLRESDRLVFITGGGNGALSLNNVVASFVPNLLVSYDGLRVVHVTGRLHEALFSEQYDTLITDKNLRSRVAVSGFLNDLYAYSGAADVVITRAGATNLAEFALQRKACIVVPNPYLTGGHQLKNAEYLSEKHAVICIPESRLNDEPQAMEQAVRTLLDNPAMGQEMGERFSKFAQTDAAHKLAVLLLDEAQKTKRK